ncbi:non-ribosomal peptide synthetase [Methylovulum psychrotolerans]|uniref:non-ribosomal peptide synthetase n=1 Tax=Methylovulum psychrotolerans TaxID=1704499 RepID=UPI0012F752BE|nr:non-ribosomal peptide synthetase [Methylovulum psychrotolerans]
MVDVVIAPQHLCAHQLFERHAAMQPDAPALDYAGQTLSYGGLNRQANRAAHALRRLGVRPDGRVAVCAGRGVAAIVGLLAALKAGGAYVPIDPALPDGRLAYLLADSQPVAVLADAAGLARLPEGLGLPVRVLDAAGGLADSDGLGDVVGFGHNIDPAAVGLAPGHLAYVIYTSGSTGQPKGVMNPHRGLCNLVQAQPGLLGIRPASRVLQFASLGFDASVWEIFTALGNGACLCLADTGALLPGAALAATLVGQGISHALLPPAAVATLPDPSALAGLTLIVGGDVCPPALAQRWAAHVRLFNAYGPTEAAVFVTTHACLSHRAGSVPIGRPIANTQVYILDRHLQAVPPGVAGELYIGGAGVARGYLNRPALTAERFIANPFLKGGDGDAGDSNGNAYPCLYKTGDLGRWLPDGSIAYLGRNDFQVKLRGFRIELGEIEARLCLCPDIREAVVIAREDQPGDRRLVAYLIPEAGQVPDPAELRRTLAGQLAEYMLPAAFVSLEQFPLTANGKLDRQALPAPDGGAAARGYEAPQGATETLIAGLWQELLHLGQVGRHDQFFELGGHSLLAVQLVARLRQTLGVEVPLREVFAHPVLAEFALSVGQTAHSALPPILPCDRSRPIPLAWAQQRLWFLAQLDPAASLAYHLPLGVRLDGRLDRAALSAALDRIIARHEALRTTFSEDDGEPRQHIAPAGCGFCLAEHDLSGLDSAAQAAAVTGHSAAEAETAFDFGHGPLIRGRLLRLAADAHLLLVTQHHIISDGWSVGRLLHEFAALYAAYCQGLPDPLPPLALHYPDYAAWQRQWLQGAALNAQLSHWRQHLDAAPALLALPTDRPRPARQSYHGADWRFRLPPELSRAVSQYGQRHGATLFMTLLTAWAVLLSRLSGQTDVVIGTPIANRRHAELEPLLGFFANTLALRVRLDGDPSADALLAQVKATTLAAYAHQDLPFEQLVEALNPPRSLAHSPVFQVLLSLDNTPGGGLPDLPGLRLSGHGQDRQTTQFDLSLSLAEHGGVLSGTLQYATDLFDAASAERIAGYYQTLLGQLTADGQCPVSRLPLLSAAQRRQLLDTFNATEADYPQHLCVHQLFERQAAQTPAAVALVFEGHSLSYAELNRLANRLAHRLLALGVRPDSRVGICAERSLEMVIGLLAILKAGGAYLPLDPAYPDGRLAYLLEDGQPVALLTQTALRARLQGLPGGGLPCIVMDGLPDAAGQGGDDLNPDPQVLGLTPAHLAYVIYTSGSTGQPKGVMIEHRNTLNLIAWASTEFSSAQLAQTLFATAINFDLAVFELFVPLSTGACVRLLKDLRGSDSPLDCVTLINTVPSAAKLLLDNRRIPARAKTINLAGEPLTRTLAERLFTDSPAETVVNLYGPTETTTYSTWVAMPKAGGFLSHIGRPIANTQIYILDSHRQPVPLGVTGELYIGGAGVARGYLHRPELTAERFIDNPFRPDSAARLYKTGDIGRWWPDGTIEYLGRNDFQVKLRGFRIELGEIEARLCLCPGIGEAVVIAREDMPGDQRLVAYVVPAAGHSPDPAGLRRQLAVHLADYMLPAAFVSLAALPLTANGKLDRNALPAPEGDTAATRCYEAPQGHTETVIAGLWQELLHLEHVGRQDQFFELGGHSLLAVQLAARLRQTLGVELPLSEVFAHPVLAELALSVAQAGQSLLPPLLPCDRSQPIPLSWAQQRLWFLAKLNPEASAAFHITAGLRLQGKLNKTALKATLDRIVRRHEILRTCFVSVDGQPQQVIAEPGFALWERDLRPPTADPIDINRLCAEETARPFNLAQGPLIRGQLLQLADDCHILLITQHHIISDGWSFGIIVQEVGALYPAFCQGLADPLPPLAVQYADYAVWQRQWLQGEVLAQHLDFWRQTLSAAPTLLSLPTDKPRPAVRSHAGGNIGFTVSAALSTAVKELADQQNATLFMALLSAWSVLMARLSGQTDIVIGTPAANRPLAELAPLIGFFVNTLALRVPLTNDPTIGELLAQVKDLALQAQAHQAMPFEQIVEALNPERSLGHNPIFQVWLNLNNTPEVASLAFPELDIIGLDVPQHTTQFDLTLSLTVVGKEIVGNLGYSKDLFDVPTVQRFICYFLAILTQMADQPALRISQLELLTPAEQQWLMQLNQTAAAYPTEKSLHGLFEAQAAQTPAATALMFAGQAMSYAALDAQANQLAHYLQAQGIRAEMPVALCVERSPAMLVGLLGILKAGGVYVPIDPDYPVERIGYILQDTQAPVLLTQQHLRNRLPQDLAKLVCLDQPGILADYPADKPQVPLQPLNLAYIIYTSGSTGQPKGVLVSHRNAVQSTTARFAAYKNPLRAFLLVSPFVFDSSVAGLFWTLSQGACLCLPEPEVAKNPTALAALIAREQISHILALPSFYTALLAQGAEQLQTLNTVIVAGETCPVEAVKHHYAQLGHAALYNEYGPTEATVWSSVYAASAADSNRPLPIGKPIANVRLYVLDAGLMRVPVGVTGELYIGGAGISRGYLHRPDLTAERFIPDPFGADGGRLYKTGDLARYQPDGNLEFLGRSDQQVKVRGFRIELGEIEARLAACTGLSDVAVLVREDQPGDKRLVAYLQTADSLPVAQLRGELQAVLPEYMIPSAFVCLSQWPITANGKLDRHALPAPDSTAVALQGYAAPQGAVETTLAELWQTLLGISQVGRDDHFFELGGHSLLAITLIEQIQQQGYAADVMSVFTTPVLAEMAASIAETAANREVFSVPPNVIPTDCTALTPDMLPLVTLSHSELAQITALIPGGAANIADIYPLSPLQEGMVFHHLLATDGDAYLMRLLFRFDQRSRLAAFLEALQTVINRHDILRTAIVWQGLAEPVQVVQRHALLPMTELACSAGEDAMQGLLARTDPGQLRLDLQQAPLFAAYYSHDAASGTWLLALLNHHVIRDHITGELVLAEIQALLAGQGGRLAASLPYRNYIAQARAVPVSHHEAYFRQQLAEVTEPTAPFGYLDVQGDGKDSREAQLPLSPALSQAILQCAKQQGVANAVIFHAAWAQVLAGCTGRDDVVFGTVLSGRLQGLGVSDQALGMFMNTLPIRICLAHLTAGQLVQETHRQLTGLLAHEQAPLALAQRCSGVTASLPLFTAVLNYRHSHKAGDEAANAAWQGVELLRAEERTNYPITLSVDDLGESFSLAAQCIGSIDPARVAAYLEAAISQLTGALLHQLDQPVSQLSILPEPERQQLLYGFNHTATAYPQHLCAHQLFERHAAMQPDAPALDYAGQTLSYGGLNRQANRAKLSASIRSRLRSTARFF